VDRDRVIINECRGKSVLHVGACDAPFELDKGQSGQLLHQKIRAVASRTVGVDIDGPAIGALRELGVDDILQADMTQDLTALAGETFDVILCCDVIEHVPSPGLLLQACRRYMRPDSKLVVTTINATALKPALRALMGREAVHNEHVAYYSFATLGKLLVMEKLRPVEFGVFAYPTINPIVGWATQSLMKAAPGSADGIIVNAQLA
jgi:2-polyprenyl-3-methyl-5-hydroxy-6-metoxy-1,4-benzoquinol methylase